jgi:sugar phosphate isomerase/epimerase
MVRTGLLAALGSSVLAKAWATQPGNEHSFADTGDDWQGFKVGIASYTFRKMSLEDTIKAIRRLGLSYISIKDFHMPLTSTSSEIQAVVKKLKDGGITPMSCGNITMQNDEKDIRRAFQYAKDGNIPVIVCSPHPDSMPILDRMVKEFNIKLAIHNHGPEDKRFPSPYDVMKAVKGYDQRIGLCIDVGHTARAGVNPADAIIKCKDRLYDLHFKDINSTAPNGGTIEAGRGVLDLPSIVQSIKKIRYSYLVGIEYEGSENDPLPSVAETVGYAKGLLEAGATKKRKG